METLRQPISVTYTILTDPILLLEPILLCGCAYPMHPRWGTGHLVWLMVAKIPKPTKKRTGLISYAFASHLKLATLAIFFCNLQVSPSLQL